METTHQNTGQIKAGTSAAQALHHGDRKRELLAATASLAMLLFSSWSLNCNLFPLYEQYVTMLREICTLANGAMLVVLAFVFTSHPRIIRPKAFMAIGTAGALLGGALIWAGDFTASTIAVVAGACLTSVAEGICTIVVMLMLVALTPRRSIAAIIIGEIIGIILRQFCPVGFSVEMICVHAGLVLGAMALAAKPALRVAASLKDDTPARSLAITQPSSFLPFEHQLFICLFLFRILYGLMLTFGERGGAPVYSTLDIIPPLALLAAFAARKPITADTLFKAAILLATASLLLMPASSIISLGIIQGLLGCAVVIFEIFNLVVLVSLSRRNIHSALAVFSWGWALNSFGVVLGANMGRAINANWTDNLSFSVLATAALTFCFIAYVVLFLQGFNFEKTISEIREPAPVVVPPPDKPTVRDLDECCDEIAEECGLTKRETEVMKLLARGRSGVFIQDELVVSYNTVKSHVKHIYMKTNAHTHQELIDLVESRRRKGAPA